MSIYENIMRAEYRTKKIINLREQLENSDFETLNQLQISVENKTYTEFEFDVLKLEVERYDRANENDFTLYCNYTEDETRKKFAEIMESQNFTEREIVLLNMYIIASRSEKVKTYRQNPEEKGVSRERMDALLKKIRKISNDIDLVGGKNKC